MSSGGGSVVSIIGAVLSIAGYPYIGIPMMVGGSIYTQQTLKKEAMERMKSAMTGLRANTRTTERPIPVIYGRHRVGGNILWMSTEGKGSNDAFPPRNKLFVVYGISEGPIDGYEEMFFNDVKVWDARSGELKTQFYNRFYPEFRTGTNSQAPFSHVATYHNLYDIASETFPLTAVALVEFFYNPDVYQSIPNVTWTIRGKQVPDWTDPDSPGIIKWTQSGPLQVADLLTNKQYGMGISSANLSVSDLTSAHAYATAPISPGSRETVEVVDMSAQRPKYYERNVLVPSVLGYIPSEDYFDTNPTGGTWGFRLTDKLPIKPGSLSFTGAYSSYVDVPRSGMISQFGQLFTTPGSIAVGSVNYLTGDVLVEKPVEVVGESGIIVLDYMAKWYADWEFSCRTKYQNVARSLYVVSTPETLVETGTVTNDIVNLYSSQGGCGTFNYGTGELNAFFGAHEWYDNQPVEIHYRVSTRARFSTNYPLFEPEKVMDAIKNIQKHYRGFLVYANGKYGIKVDKPEGSVYSFDDDNICAGTFRLHQPSIKEIPTRVILKYLDALNNDTPAEASFDVRSVDPGMEIEHVLDMPGTTARDEAMASAYSYANLANLVNFIEFETNHNAIGVEAGDVVDVTHPSAGWVGKLFRVLGISFAKDDKLAISAIEHDPTAYVDDWMQGPMVSRNPSFFPKRSYWPPNVSSATLSEYSRTLSDGTTTPAIKYQIMAVDSANLSVDHWNIYYSNLKRGQQARLGYSGVNTVGYLSPVEPGWNVVNIHAVSQFGNESAKVWTGSVNVGGAPEYEWQRWRVQQERKDIMVVASALVSGFIDRTFISSAGDVYHSYISSGTSALIARINHDGSQNTCNLGVAGGGASFDWFHIVSNSGGNPAVFWSPTFSGIYTRGATVTASMTLVNTIANVNSTSVNSYVRGGAIFNTLDGKIGRVGGYQDAASKWMIGFSVISTNLSQAGATVTSIFRPGSIWLSLSTGNPNMIDYAADASALSVAVGSGHYFLLWYYANSSTHYQAKLWKFTSAWAVASGWPDAGKVLYSNSLDPGSFQYQNIHQIVGLEQDNFFLIAHTTPPENGLPSLTFWPVNEGLYARYVAIDQADNAFVLPSRKIYTTEVVDGVDAPTIAIPGAKNGKLAWVCPIVNNPGGYGTRAVFNLWGYSRVDSHNALNLQTWWNN